MYIYLVIKMKILSIVLLLSLTFTIQDQISGVGRDFLTGMLRVIKGQEIALDEACFGSEFDRDVQHLIDNYRTGDIILTLASAGKLINDIGLKCPSSDLAKISKDAMALGPLELFSRIQKHKQEILEMLKEEFIKGKVTAYTVGEAYGHIINIWIYEKTQTDALKFLGS
jgi:hypothetical protein